MKPRQHLNHQCTLSIRYVIQNLFIILKTNNISLHKLAEINAGSIADRDKVLQFVYNP